MVDVDPQAQSENRLTCTAPSSRSSILLACHGAFAADLTLDRPVPPAAQAVDSPTPPVMPADDTRLGHLQKPEAKRRLRLRAGGRRVVREAPNCKSFSDGCRTCSLTACSNIGIACQPKEWSCNDAATDSKPEAKPDAKSESKK